jgi:osmoprotectant transport system substrate-binding protein
LAAALAAATLFVAACGGDDEEPSGGGSQPTATATQAADTGAIAKNDANSAISLKIGSKNFTEQKVLGEIYAQGLAAAGYTTTTDLNLGDQDTALAALKGGQIDAYPEYTGTALTAFFKKDAADLPKDATAAYEQLKGLFEADGITAFPPTPFTSSNEVAVTQEKADELGIANISDLAEHDQDLTLYGSPECRERDDCLLGLQEVYGLDFRRFVPVDIALRHEVLTKGQADVSIVFTTDPQIQREQFVLLEDDKGMFPPYNSTLVMRSQVAQQGGSGLEEVVAQVNEGLTDEAMQELNARVDLDKKTAEQVAGEYLSETGLVQ